MKKFLTLIIITLTICGCSPKKDTYKYSANQEIERIMQTENYEIVDVRTASEYQESHIKGAINIPYDEIDENTKLDKNKTILVYCKSGRRSSIAYQKLTSLGYKSYDLGAFTDLDLEKE